MSSYHKSVGLLLNRMVREGARVVTDSSGMCILASAEDARGAYEMVLYINTYLYRIRRDEYGRTLSKEIFVCNAYSHRWEVV